MLNLIIQIVLETSHLFLEVWHWITLGFFAAGLIREFVPEKKLVKILGGRGVGSLLKASVLGVLADFLPHSSLQLAISLFDLGASRASVMTFMVSTPWLCIVESLILISFTGVELFLFIVVMTMVVSVLGGLAIGYLEKRGLIETGRPRVSKHATDPEKLSESKSLRGRVHSALRYSYHFLKIGGPWLAVGFLGAGIAKTVIPMEAIRDLLGYSVYSVPLALGIGAIMETTLEASVPIICNLYSLGASPGVIFTLLMTGIVTDVTELGTITTLLGRKTAIASTLIYSFLTLIFGYLINLIL